MPILAGVGMQLRTLARLKQRTLINAAVIFADFMLVYYMIASKRCGSVRCDMTDAPPVAECLRPYSGLPDACASLSKHSHQDLPCDSNTARSTVRLCAACAIVAAARPHTCGI